MSKPKGSKSGMMMIFGLLAIVGLLMTAAGVALPLAGISIPDLSAVSPSSAQLSLAVPASVPQGAFVNATITIPAITGYRIPASTLVIQSQGNTMDNLGGMVGTGTVTVPNSNTLAPGTYHIFLYSDYTPSNLYNGPLQPESIIGNPISLAANATFTVVATGGGGGGTTKGILGVEATVNGNYSSGIVKVTLNGKDYAAPFQLQLDPGQYSLTATYGSQSQNQSATITAGQTTNIIFAFAGQLVAPASSSFINAVTLTGSILAVVGLLGMILFSVGGRRK